MGVAVALGAEVIRIIGRGASSGADGDAPHADIKMAKMTLSRLREYAIIYFFEFIGYPHRVNL